MDSFALRLASGVVPRTRAPLHGSISWIRETKHWHGECRPRDLYRWQRWRPDTSYDCHVVRRPVSVVWPRCDGAWLELIPISLAFASFQFGLDGKSWLAVDGDSVKEKPGLSKKKKGIFLEHFITRCCCSSVWFPQIGREKTIGLLFVLNVLRKGFLSSEVGTIFVKSFRRSWNIHPSLNIFLPFVSFA